MFFTFFSEFQKNAKWLFGGGPLTLQPILPQYRSDIEAILELFKKGSFLCFSTIDLLLFFSNCDILWCLITLFVDFLMKKTIITQ